MLQHHVEVSMAETFGDYGNTFWLTSVIWSVI